jgi:ABC-type iron transport system FetAB permease component
VYESPNEFDEVAMMLITLLLLWKLIILERQNVRVDIFWSTNTAIMEILLAYFVVKWMFASGVSLLLIFCNDFTFLTSFHLTY